METYNHNPLPEESEKITRVEIIDNNGRSYVNWKSTNVVTLSLQDDGKTLKVFISNSDLTSQPPQDER